MDESLLDTDILNEVLKRKNANVVRHAADYLAQHGQFAVSASVGLSTQTSARRRPRGAPAR